MIVKKLFGELFIYAFANAINRGTLLLVSPILLTSYTVEDVGKFSVTYAISQFIMPIVALGMTSAIVREGVSNQGRNNYLTLQSIVLSIVIGIAMLLVFMFFENQQTWNLKYAVGIGTLNTIIELILASFRTSNKKISFSVLCLAKSSAIILATALSIFYAFDVEWLFITIALSLLIVCVCTLVKLLSNAFILDNNLPLANCLKYSIFMVPHAVSVWAISSIDKVIIDLYSTDYDLGLYSLSYTVGMIFLIINSGIALALPQYMFSKIENYLDRSVRNSVLKYYTIFYGVLIVAVELVVFLDKIYIGLLPTDDSFYVVYRIVIFGIYLSGVYQFYSLFLVYKRSTKMLSKISFLIAFINISLNFILIPHYGILAAAWVTLISYLVYLIIIYFAVCSEYQKIDRTRFSHLSDISLYSIVTAILLVVNSFIF